MMLAYSLILCFMPPNGCCIFKVGAGEGGALGLFAGHFQSSLPRCLACSAVWVFAWLAWSSFVSPGRIFFSLSLALERLQQQSFSGFSRWPGRFGFGPRSAKTTGRRRIARDRRGRRPLHFGPTSRKKPSRREEAHLLHVLWTGNQHQRFTRFPSTCPSCCVNLLGFSPETGAGAIFLPTSLLALVGFFLSLAFWVFVPVWGEGGVGGCLRSDSSISNIYLPFFLCCVGTLSINSWGFFHFHPLVFISYWWKGIAGTLFFRGNTHSRVFFS